MKNVADLIDSNDPDGRTHREVNNSKQHNIPIGTLVELNDGVRLWIVHHSRDCDGTPVYELCYIKDDIIQHDVGWRNYRWIGSFNENDLKIIR